MKIKGFRSNRAIEIRLDYHSHSFFLFPFPCVCFWWEIVCVCVSLTALVPNSCPHARLRSFEVSLLFRARQVNGCHSIWCLWMLLRRSSSLIVAIIDNSVMLSMSVPPALQPVCLVLRAMNRCQCLSKPVIATKYGENGNRVSHFIFVSFIFKMWKKLTSTYETGKIPFRLAILPSNQLSSTRRVRTTSSPLCNESSMADWAWKLNLARAWPSDGFFVGHRTPSFDTI